MFTTIFFVSRAMSKNPSARLENLRWSVMIVIFEKVQNFSKILKTMIILFPKNGKEIKFIENC